MVTIVTDSNNTIDEIRSAQVGKITRAQFQRWQDELFTRSEACTTDEEWEYCDRLSDALGSKLCEFIESASQDEQDECLRILPSREEWAARVADDIEKALEAGAWRAAQLGEKMLQQAFDAGTIRKH